MKSVLFFISIAGLLTAAGCESDHHHEHAEHWDHREHRVSYPVYRVEPGYAPPPVVYGEHPEYHR